MSQLWNHSYANPCLVGCFLRKITPFRVIQSILQQTTGSKSHATQTNLGLATHFKCKLFMTLKLDTEMFVTMTAGTVPDVFLIDRREKQR